MVAQRGGGRCKQRRPEARANGNDDDGGEKKQLDILATEPRLINPGAGKPIAGCTSANQIGTRHETARTRAAVHGGWSWGRGFVAANDVDADMPNAAQIMHHRTVNGLDTSASAPIPMMMCVHVGGLGEA